MENNERDRKLDQWLDEALSQYSAAEPRLGLERRVLASVQAEEHTQTGRKRWWRWMPALAAIAAVLVVMVAVRPYWEKEAVPRAMSSNIATHSAPAAQRDQAMAAGLEEPKSAAAKKSVETAEARPREAMSAPIYTSKDANLDERREAEVSPKNAPIPASRAYRYANEETADKKALAKETDTAVGNGALKQPAQGRTVQTLVGGTVAAAPAPAPPSEPKMAVDQSTMLTAPAAAKVAANGTPTTTRDKLHTANSALSESETVEVHGTTQNAVMVPVVPSKAAEIVVGGVIAAGKAGLADATAGAKTVVAKTRAVANKAKEPIRTDAMGMAPLKTELKQVPPGPTQQFPTPTPLSDEEKMALAASKQLKAKPAAEVTGQKPDGDTNAVEIKKIEIAPLPGPPK